MIEVGTSHNTNTFHPSPSKQYRINSVIVKRIIATSGKSLKGRLGS